MSLFPAYATSPPSTSASSDAPVATTSISSFPSFASALSEHRRSSSSPEVVTVESDDSVEVIKERKRKKKQKHERKEKKRRKDKDRDKEKSSKSKKIVEVKVPSRPVVEERPKWSFLDTRNAKLSDDQPFIVDRFPDFDNFHYDSIYKRHVPEYTLQVKRCLGGNKVIDSALFGAKAVKTVTERYFDRKALRRFANKSGTDVQNPSVRRRSGKNLQDLGEFVPVVQQKLKKNEEELLWDPSIQMYVPVTHQPEEQDAPLPLTEADAQTRSQLINKRLQEEPHNIDLWLRFLRTQDEVFMAELPSRSKKDAKSASTGGDSLKMTDRQLVDRKLAIVDRALLKNVADIRLKLARLAIGRDVWDRERLKEEWKKVEFQHVNRTEMWDGYLSFGERHLATFSVTAQLALYDRCLQRLQTVLYGTMKTHPALPGTEHFLLDVLLRRCRFLLSLGFPEKAIACLQAALEFNFFRPVDVDKLQLEDKRRYFEPFWDSAAPRIGDEGAIGWAETMRLIHADSLANKENMEEREMAQETQMYDQMEDALCKDAVVRDLPDGEVWAAVESLRSQRLWRPIRRAPDDLEDPDRVVLYDDVKSCLIELADADNRRRLLIESLMMLGARFPDETSVNDVTTLCTDFDKLPRLDNRLIGMESLGMRLFEVAQQLYPVNKEATYFACAQLVYAADSLTTRTDLRPKDRSKQFKKMAKELMEKRPRDCWPLYATYAEQLARLGDETGAAQVAQKTLAMCAAEKSVWQLANTSEQLPVLRLLTVFLAGQDLQYYPALLADIGLYGRLQTATSSAAHLVKAKAAWLEKVASLASDKDVESDWQGCSLSLAASLCARFVYTVAIGRDKLRAALAVFEHTLQALTGASKVSKRERERLTKVKIDLIDDYLNSDPTAPPRLLRDALEQAVIEFPDNTDFLKRFIDLNLRGHALVGLRRFFDQRSSDHPLVVRSVGAVYAELARYISLVEAADDAFALPEIHRIRAVLDRCAERHPETAVFWRFRAHFEQLRGDKNAVLQVFYRAVRQCPYEKALFLDCARAYPQKASMLVDLMIEKGLRLRCPIEEVDILREAAGGQKRVIEDSDDDSSSDGEK